LKATLRDLRFKDLKEEQKMEKQEGRRPKGSCVFMVYMSPVRWKNHSLS